MNTLEPYYKKTIHYKFENYILSSKVSQDLFSSLDIDHGTQRLLRTLLFEKIDTFKKALDVGCGYGVIGIILKKICPNAEVHMVDRDALAIAYTKENVILNDVTNKSIAYGSLGYDNISDRDF